MMLGAMLALAAVTSAPVPVISLGDVIDHKAQLNGSVVRVRGWLGQCSGLSCLLYPSLSAAHNNGEGSLSVGAASPKVEAALEANAFTQVILQARFDATCLDERAECVDRPSTLKPISLERVHTNLLPPQPK